MTTAILSGEDLRSAIERLLDEYTGSAIALRQALHADPEVGGTEDRTVHKLLDYLAPDAYTRIAEGFVLTTGADGPLIGVRAELDALAVQESSTYEHASQVRGIGHLCGHDVHMAALALTTRVASHVDLGVRLVSVFQPREETVPSGAVDIVGDSAFHDLPLSAMLGFHLQPTRTQRTFSALPGAVNASADEFVIRINGEPSHGAYPHHSRDPITAAAQLVTAAQTLISRESDPMQPSVLSFGRIHGGDAVNAIPESVQLAGTIRSFSEESRARLHDGLRRVGAGVALAANVDIDIDIDRGEPVLINHENTATTVSDALEASGFTRGLDMRSCGADDFAYYGSRAPSTMVFVGAGTRGADAPGLHHPAFAPDDRVVREIAEMMLASVIALGRTEEVK